MNRIVVMLAALLLTDVHAQPAEVGVFFSGGKDLHSTHFTALPGTFSCSPGFRSSFGNSWGLGALATFNMWSIPLPLSKGEMLPTIRIGYENWSTTFTTREQQPIGLDTTLATATIEHRAQVQGSFLSLHGGATVKVSPSPIIIEPRLWAAFVVSPQYEQGEYLVQPERRGRFPETGTRSRNLSSGQVSGTQTLQFGFSLGVGWDIILSQQLKLHPEVHVQVPFHSLFGDVLWRIYSLRAGIAVLVSPSPSQPSPVEIEHEHPTILTDTAGFIATNEQQSRLPPLALHFVTRDSNDAIIPVHKVTVTAQRRRHIRPLLPYIFFEENGTRIPNRYILLDSHSVNGFTESELHSLTTLESYYHLLNIIGLRMKQYPTATLVITGCTMGIGVESNRLDLAEGRARAVRAYLHSVWGIDTTRCRITAQLLPTRPSPIGHPDGNAENARVELYSTHSAILAPIIGVEEDYTVTPASVFIHIDSPRPQVLKWEFSLIHHQSVIATHNGRDRLPTFIPLNVHWAGLTGNILRAELKRSMLGLNLPIEDMHVQSLPVIYQQDTASPHHETYSLILFDFDDATIPPSQYSMIDMIRYRITPTTNIRIIGYTDRLGNLPYNVRLAERRAQVIARALGVEQHATIIAEGSRTLLYDNTLPEGRFYSRTIVIELDQP